MSQEANITAVLQIRDEMSKGMGKINDTLAQLQKGFQRTHAETRQMNSTLTQFQRGMNSAASSISNVLGVARLFSLAFIVNQFRQVITESIHLADELDKMSKVTGINVEQLQKYQFAAKMANVSNGEFQASLRILQLRAQDAAQGGEEAGKAFRKLGIDMEENAELADDTNALFRKVADALSHVENRGERMKLGNQLLGRTFAQLSPLIEGGTKQLDEFGNILERTNGIISKDSVEALDKFGDQITFLETQWTALKANFATMVAESGILPKLLTGFLEFSKVIALLKTMFMTGIDAIAIFVGRGLEAILHRFTVFFDAFKQNAEVVVDFFSSGKIDPFKVLSAAMSSDKALKSLKLDTIKGEIDTAWQEVNDATQKRMADYEDAIRLIDAKNKELLDGFKAIEEQGPKTGKAIQQATGGPEAAKQAGETKEIIDQLAVDLRRIDRQFNLTNDAEMKVTQSLEAYTKEMERLRAESSRGREPRKEEIEQYGKLKTVVDALKKKLEEMVRAKEKEKATREAQRQRAEEIQNLQKMLDAFSRLGKEGDALRAKINLLRAQLDDQGKKMVENTGQTDEAAKAYFTLSKQLREAELALRKVAEDEERLLRISEKLKEMNVEFGFNEAVKEMSDDFKTFKDLFLETFDMMRRAGSEAFMALTESGRKSKDRLKSFFKDLSQSFRRMLADFASQEFMRGIFGMGQAAPGGVNPISLGIQGVLSAGSGSGGVGGGLSMSQPGISPLGAAIGLGSLSQATAPAGGAGFLSGLFGGSGAFGISAAGTGLLGIGGLAAASSAKDPVSGGLLGGLGGGLLGASLFAGPAAPLIMGLGGLLFGGLSGSKAKEEAEKAKEEQEQAAQEAAEQLEEQRKRAANIIKTHIRTSLGGGLATPEAAASVGALFSGDISADEVAAFGNVDQILARGAQVDGMAQVVNNMGGVSINVKVDNVATTYDVQRLAEDLGYYLSNQFSGG